MNEMISKIIKARSVQGTLFVLKGYPIEPYGGIRVNMADVISNKLGMLLQLSSMECQIISFDEFICLYEFLNLQYKKIIILENPEYMNLYPVNVNINEDISRSLLNHFDDTVGGDTELVDIEEYILVYNNYISTDAGIACCYNISDSLLKSEKIERIVVKISEERSLDIISDAEVIKDYINLCNEIDF